MTLTFFHVRRRLGPKSDHVKTARIIHSAERTLHVLRGSPLLHGSGAVYPGNEVLIYSWYWDIEW